MNTAISRRISLETLYTIYESVFYSTVFCMYGMYTTYLTAYGFSNTFIALSLSITGFINMGLNPLLAVFLDKTNNCRIVNLTAIASTEIAVLLFFSPIGKTNAMAIVFAIFGNGGIRVLMSETDTWVSKLIAQGEKINYGSMRAAGSMAYAASAFIVGRVLAILGYDFARWIFTVLLTLCFIIALMIPNPHMITDSTGKVEKVSMREAFGKIKASKTYLVYLICGMLYMTTNLVCENYIGPLVLSMGGTSKEVGMMSGLLAVIEFIAMPYYARVADRVGTRRLLTIGFFGFALKAITMSFAPTLPILFMCAITQMVSFVIMVPSRIRLVSEEIPAKYIATALILSNLSTSIISTFVGNPLAGRLADSVGLQMTFRIMSLPALDAGLIFGTFTMIYDRTHPEGGKVSSAHEPYEAKETSDTLRATLSALTVALFAVLVFVIYRVVTGTFSLPF